MISQPSRSSLVAMALCLGACSSDAEPGSPTMGPSPWPSTAADAGSTHDTGAPPSNVLPNVDAAPPTPSDHDASSDAVDGGAPRDSSVEDPDEAAFAACVAALKPKCTYDEKETACGSMVTKSIPLTNGGTAGGIEIPSGPHGAYVEWNEGAAFKNPTSPLENTCDLVAATFGEPQTVTADVLDLRGQDLSLYTVFRPACMRAGDKYPVITWGNGTCGQAGGYGALLATVASHGFVVIAANSRFTNQGNKEMLKALDFAAAANDDANSVYYQRLDLDKIGAMGHSQGSSATRAASSDPRVKAVILWNGGSSADKPFLAVSGDRDIGNVTVSSLSSGVNAAAQPGAWLYFHKVLETGGNFTGHLTLMEQPERAWKLAVSFWRYMLDGDAEAKKMFVGDSCGLCNQDADFEYGQHNLP